ncbi:MAG: sel1 repeat family protein [Pseudomonadota bacterium]
MARYERIEDANILSGGTTDAEVLFNMGMMYATGRSVETDLVAAHKWFNLAAVRGHGQAAGLRQEISREMSTDDIAEALRSAREWLATVH